MEHLAESISDLSNSNLEATLNFEPGVQKERVNIPRQSIWVGWKDFIQIHIIRNHSQFIFLRVDNLIQIGLNESFFGKVYDLLSLIILLLG
ncbi:hypothetical protein EPI10_006856 [Gossypium australe]|uniref:Uncharacterized protein n=1 Tax=Gossypium australe TaxID=47621 RepID=A0A5B6WTI2_9ROSI|nr:hypothetical protein EPI10_006856 [Gossypium australe]